MKETTFNPSKKCFAPLLAATIEEEALASIQLPVLVSPKIDGIRCLCIHGTAYSRSLKPIRNGNVQKMASALYKDYSLDLLDGELTAGNFKTKIQDTTSEVMSFDGGSDFTYNVFDIQGSSIFTERYLKVAALETTRPLNGLVRPVKQGLCYDIQAVKDFLSKSLDQGYEGAMLRSLTGPYKHGRSTLREGTLIKLKPFVDAEATIVGAIPLFENNNEAILDELGHQKRSKAKEGLRPLEMLGALKCVTADGIPFKIGTGFTQGQRFDLWHMPNLVGTLVHFKYQGYGVKTAPRNPVFLNLVSELE